MKSLLSKIHNVAHLRWALLAFIVALGAPAMALVYYSLTELKWESFYQQRNLAIELTERINLNIYHWVEVEERRAYSDYQFNEGGPANYFQPSPLSALDLTGTLPGAIGYFQVGANGEFSSPVLPGNYVDAARYGISSGEYKQREVLKERILQILLDNQLLQTQQPPPEPQTAVAREEQDSARQSEQAEEPQQVASAPQSEAMPSSSSDTGQQRLNRQGFDQRLRDQQDSEPKSEQSNVAFEKLSQQKAPPSAGTSDRQLLTELEIGNTLQEAAEKRKSAEPAPPASADARAARKEQYLVEMQDAMPEAEAEAAAASDSATSPRVTMFESEIYPFEFSPLNSGHFVFYRKVWRKGALIIQGLLLEREAFLQQTIGREYRQTVLSTTADLTVAYRGSVMASFDGDGDSGDRGGELLHQSRLAAPFNGIELLFSINQLPAGPGALVVRWSAIVMALVLALGTWFLYRLGLRQMRLVQQQQDFVSAVSHELKTPLTSIRMYGEMLREGWADESKKRQYYDYIYDESERLSRLIANVLQLARMNRKELDLNVQAQSLSGLVDNLRSKLHSQIDRGGFEFQVDVASSLRDVNVMVDSDSFLQVFINLVDNALKFAAKSDSKKIDLTVSPAGQYEILFALRDYGPGIDKQHLHKIFELFYRAENELTRKTVGTGIGLALVHQLVRAMEGRVEASNTDPGAEFRVYLKRVL